MNQPMSKVMRDAIISISVLLLLEDVFLLFGITFSFRNHEPFWSWAWVWVTFIADFLAVPLALLTRRVSAYSLLVCSALSMTIACISLLRSAESSPSVSHRQWVIGIAELILEAAIFWGLKLILAFLLLLSCKRPDQQA